MKPAPFEYHAPDTLEEALALLAEHGDEAKPLAGGQSLIPVLNFRLARPAVLVDLNGVRELFGIGAERAGSNGSGGGGGGGGLLSRAVGAARAAVGGDARGGGMLRIGAMTRQRVAERSGDVAARAPLLAEALAHVAHPQIRNRGTIGGSVAHADPGAELPAVMLALEATLRLRSAAGQRQLPARDFFTGLFATALQPGELLDEVRLPPLPPRAGCAFVEVARRHGDYALAGVAAVVVLDDDGVCREARIAYVNCGPGPLRSAGAEAALVGERPLDEGGPEGVGSPPAVIEDAARAALAELRPPSDVHATTEYRGHLARVLTVRAVRLAAQRSAAHV